jgi:hypothetical protein
VAVVGAFDPVHDGGPELVSGGPGFVDDIPVTNWCRPDGAALAARGLPKVRPAGQDAPLLGRGIDLLRLAAVLRDSNRRMAENLRQ